jgi:pimeloyl-ACP methyl ester carboxylesterase
LGWLNDSKPGTPNYVARNGHNAVAADAGGPQTWGNQAAIDGAQRSYVKVQTMPGTKPGKVFLIGASMGGLTALNWAAANPDKVAGIVLIIPVINVNDVKINNRGGYASLVNAAHGGNYDETTQGATKNPATMKHAGKFAGIPILLYYGLTDTVCVPAEAEAFASVVGPNVETVALNSGHDNASYLAVDNARIINFFNTHG